MGIPHGEPSRREITSESLYLDRMSAPIFRCPGIWTALNEEFSLGPHKDLVKKGHMQTLGVDIKDHRCVVGAYTNTWRSLRSGRKCLSAWNTASISRQLMCHVRWRTRHRPLAGWPLMTAPQPMRDASVTSITRWQGAPSTRPSDKNQGFLHMSKACRHRHVTFIMRRGFPLRENPLVLSHNCRGLLYSRPKGITLNAADIRPNSFWNCLTVRNN